MQSFYPPRGSRQSTGVTGDDRAKKLEVSVVISFQVAGETCDPEAVWRAVCLAIVELFLSQKLKFLGAVELCARHA